MWSILNMAVGFVFCSRIQLSQSSGIAQRVSLVVSTVYILSIFFFHSGTMSIMRLSISQCVCCLAWVLLVFFPYEVAVSTFTTISLRNTRKRSLQLLQFHQWQVIYNDERYTSNTIWNLFALPYCYNHNKKKPEWVCCDETAERNELVLCCSALCLLS